MEPRHGNVQYILQVDSSGWVEQLSQQLIIIFNLSFLNDFINF